MGSEFDPAGTDAGYVAENPNEVDAEFYEPPTGQEDPFESAYGDEEEDAQPSGQQEPQPQEPQPQEPNYAEQLKQYGGIEGVQRMAQQMRTLEHRYNTDPAFRAAINGQQQQRPQQPQQQQQPQQGAQFDPNNPEAFWTNAFYNPSQYFVTPQQMQQFQQQLHQQLATLQAHLQYQQFRPEIEAMDADLKGMVQQGRIRLEDAVQYHRNRQQNAKQPSPQAIQRERGSQERHDAKGSKGASNKSSLLNKPAKSARGARLKAKAQAEHAAKTGERLNA